jgi:hypothetical protein
VKPIPAQVKKNPSTKTRSLGPEFNQNRGAHLRSWRASRCYTTFRRTSTLPRVALE